MGTAVLCFSYGKAKAEVEAKEDKTLKSLESTEKPSILMERIFDQESRDPEEDDTEDDMEDDTETTEDNKKPTGGHDGRDEVDEIQLTDQETEDRDDGSTTTTTKKPFIVSFWPR